LAFPYDRYHLQAWASRLEREGDSAPCLDNIEGWSNVDPTPLSNLSQYTTLQHYSTFYSIEPCTTIHPFYINWQQRLTKENSRVSRFAEWPLKFEKFTITCTTSHPPCISRSCQHIIITTQRPTGKPLTPTHRPDQPKTPPTYHPTHTSYSANHHPHRPGSKLSARALDPTGLPPHHTDLNDQRER